MRPRPSPEAVRQSGQAMVETVVVLFVTLLLLLGIIQFGLIFNAKTTLDYAAFEAARAGSLNYADKTAIEFALARGLAPLYTSVSSMDDLPDKLDAVKSVQKARDRVLDEIDDGQFLCMERISPDPAAFAAYAVADPTGNFDGELLIPNDHLLYRSAIPRAGAKVSIQDANLLKLRVTYCYPMHVPIISTTIKRLMGLLDDPDPVPGWGAPVLGAFRANCYRQDRFPIVAQAVMRMQTHVKNDAFDAEGSCN